MRSHRFTRTLTALLGPIVLLLTLAVGPSSAAPLSPEEANSDQLLAYQIADGYWARHWSEYFTGSYTSPYVVGIYDSRILPIPCAGSNWTSGNAWYCDATDTLGFDLAFMENVFTLGDSFIYLVVAHEWGHAIQARLNPDLRSRAVELQADCLAGAVLFGAAEDGTLRWEAGDMQEVTATLTRVADAYPWTSIGDHGNAAERIASLNKGADGPMACFGTTPSYLQRRAAGSGNSPAPGL